MYFALMDGATAHGYEHYEISNWARPGFTSRHNLKYWTGAPYWAFGVSAAGYDGHTRWSNTRHIHEYLERVERGASPVVERVELDADEQQAQLTADMQRLAEAQANLESRLGSDEARIGNLEGAMVGLVNLFGEVVKAHKNTDATVSDLVGKAEGLADQMNTLADRMETF